MQFQRILIALDGSAAAAHAGEVGGELARSLTAEIALVHAIDPALGFAPESGVAAADLISLAEQEGRALLAAFPPRARLAVPPYQFMDVGKPAEVILRVAAEWKADMIVIASHGRGGMRRLVLGSVAEAVMRRSDCPVLVVRAKE
jgi:universal stress protein A